MQGNTESPTVLPLSVCITHCVSWRVPFPSGVYEPQVCSSQKMMRVFGFASSLIEILALGLQTYNRARYRQLVKRIGRIMRSVQEAQTWYIHPGHPIRYSQRCLLSFFLEWQCVMSVITGLSMSVYLVLMDPAHTLCLRTNYSWNTTISSSELFYTCSETKGEKLASSYCFHWKLLTWSVCVLWSSHRLGIWLFMSEMPYGTLSSSMLWRVLYAMQCAETAGLETLSTACDTHSCIQALRGTRDLFPNFRNLIWVLQ